MEIGRQIYVSLKFEYANNQVALIFEYGNKLI